MRWFARMGWVLACIAVPAGVGTAARAQDGGEPERESEIEIGVPPEPGTKDEPKPGGGAEDAAGGEPASATGRIPARADGADPGWRDVASSNKLVTLSVPADWRVEETKAEADLVRFRAVMPGARGGSILQVRFRPTGWTSRTHLRHRLLHERKQGNRAEIRFEPLPHVRSEVSAEANPGTDLLVPLVLAGHPAELVVGTLPDDADLAVRDLPGLAGRIRTSRPAWPSIPEGYDTRSKGSFEYAVHPAAKEFLKTIETVVRRTERRFWKIHGRLPREAPKPVIYVHRKLVDAMDLDPRAKDASGVAWSDASGRWIFVRAIAEEDARERRQLAEEITRLCFAARYGITYPVWALEGERVLAGMVEHGGGLRPPAIHRGYRSWADDTEIPALPELARIDAGAWPEAFGRQTAYYALFFQCGSSKFRKAYLACLEETARTCDPDAAMRTHLEPLGYELLRKECDEFRKHKIEYEK